MLQACRLPPPQVRGMPPPHPPVGVGGGMFPPPSPPVGWVMGEYMDTKEIHLDT